MSDLGPYLEFVRIQTEMNKLFESLQELREPPAGSGKGEVGWLPNVDICECTDVLLVEAEMPGVDPASLDVRVGGGTLILEGNKPRTGVAPSSLYHRKDRAFGRFRRVVPLHVAVNTHKAEARLEHGILAIRFPKVANKRGEQVRIHVQRGED